MDPYKGVNLCLPYCVRFPVPGLEAPTSTPLPTFLPFFVPLSPLPYVSLNVLHSLACSQVLVLS